MKYDLTRTPTRGARRTLDAFYETLLAEVQARSFEEVTVGSLCERAGYPRATFYNYWDDKYDLLDYVRHRIAAMVGLNRRSEVLPQDALRTFFDRFFDVAQAHEGFVTRLCRCNAPGGYLFASLRLYLGGVVREAFVECARDGHASRPVPVEMAAEQMTSTVLLVLEWRFVRGHALSREQAWDALAYLLGPLAE